MRTDILKLSLLAAVLLPFSCLPLQEDTTVTEQTVRLEFLNDDATKSRYTEADMKQLRTLTVYGIDDTGYWKKACFSPGETPILRFPAGRRVSIYVLANMGNVTFPKQPTGVPCPEAFTYLLPEQMNIPRAGIPMAGKVQAQLTPSAHSMTLQVPLERLLAKVVVHIDKSGITGGVDAPALHSDRLFIRQANRRLMPFASGGSIARSTADLFTGALRIFDEEDLRASGDALEHSGLVLYVPENRQGVLLHTSDESLKIPSEMPSGKAALCTFIEYRADKDGAEDGVDGALCYRAFLGGNVSNDFSVCRNAVYNATLSLTWDGLVWRADGWRIDASGVSDQRRLRFLDASGNETSYLKIHRQGDGEFYAYFSVDDDASGGTTGRKDAPSFPYGWNLSFNGSRLSGHDADSDHYEVAKGLRVKCLGDAVVNGKNALQFSVSADRTAAITTSSTTLRHRLLLQTSDGKVSASPLYLDVEEIPYSFEWVNGEPNHVGQKGVIRCIDPYTGQTSTEGIFHLKEGYSGLSPFTNNGDGTVTVSLTGPFSSVADAITITDAFGERLRKVPLEARMPYFECTDLWTTYVDASSSSHFTYYACNDDGTKSSTILKVTDSSGASYIGNGEQLDKALVESFIKPVVKGANNKLGYTYELLEDGTYMLTAYISDYNGLNPSGPSFLVDKASIGFQNYTSTRPRYELDFTAWNPWKNISVVPQGAVLDDYTLYARPDQMKGGWLSNPPDKPNSNVSYSMQIQNIVVADEKNAKFNAKPQYAGEADYFGSICSGTPNKTAADFAADKWTLYMHVSLPNMGPTTYESRYQSLKQMQFYLNHFCGYHFRSMTDLEKYLQENNFTVVISNNYSSQAEAYNARPSYIPYTTFYTRENRTFETWTMTYSMKGKTDANMNGVHGAGPIDIVVEIKNPHGDSYLRHVVAKIYMRLHVYFYPTVINRYPRYGINDFVDRSVEFQIVSRYGGYRYLEDSNMDNTMRWANSFEARSYESGAYLSRFEFMKLDSSNDSDVITHARSGSNLYKFTDPSYKYFNYFTSLENGTVGSIRPRFIPLEWVDANDYEGYGSYYRENPHTAYYAPPTNGVSPQLGPFWDPNDTEEKGRLVHLHIIPEWYYSYSLE